MPSARLSVGKTLSVIAAALVSALTLVVMACGGGSQELPDIDATVEAKVQKRISIDPTVEARVQEKLNVSTPTPPATPATNIKATVEAAIKATQAAQAATGKKERCAEIEHEAQTLLWLTLLDFAGLSAITAEELLVESVALGCDEIAQSLSEDAERAHEYTRSAWESYQQGKYERAIEDYDKAINLLPLDNPLISHILHIRGWAYSQLGQHERAIEDHDAAWSMDSADPDTYFARGWAYNQLGQHERAIEDFDQTIAMYSEQGAERFTGAVHEIAEAYYWRGNAYQALGQNEQAERDFAKAKELGFEGSVVVTATPTSTLMSGVIFGPSSGELVHDTTVRRTRDGEACPVLRLYTCWVFMARHPANVTVRNFEATATFFNPWSSSTRNFNYGFIFRDYGEGLFDRVLFAAGDTGVRWVHDVYLGPDNNGDPVVENVGIGSVTARFEKEIRGSNTINLKSVDGLGTLTVNGVRVTDLKLDTTSKAGDIKLIVSYQEDGYVTRYEDFVVVSLD